MVAATTLVSSRKSESVRVALSIRPLLANELGNGAEECLRVTEPGKPEVRLTSDKCAPFPFAFDHVEDPRGKGIAGVFESCVQDKLLGNVLCGYNATVLAYGQTGSGKSYAMGCGAQPDAPPGLIQLTVGTLFDQLPEGAVVRASFTQIYNEDVQDLLAVERDGLARPLEVKRSGSKGWWVPDAKREIVRSLAEVSALLHRGRACRHVGETSKNALSSRSHAVFTLELALPPPSRGPSPEAGARGPTTLRPKVTFVDLAGSERTKDAGTSGAQQKEGTKINLSLFNLGSVINALGNKDSFVPYNRSVLTKLLQDSLGGSAQTLMLACASPAAVDTWETLSTLYSVSRARLIVNKTAIATSDEPALSADELAAQREEEMVAEIAQLRTSLAAARRPPRPRPLHPRPHPISLPAPATPTPTPPTQPLPRPALLVSPRGHLSICSHLLRRRRSPHAAEEDAPRPNSSPCACQAQQSTLEVQQLHAAAECAASLERMLSHVERDAVAEERGALLARLQQATAATAAAEAEGSAVRAVAAEAETVRARALEEREEAVQRWREMQAELEQAHKLRAASVTAATAADIRARAAEFDLAAAERKATEAMATVESAVTAGAAVGAAEVESEAVVVAEGAAEGAAAGARPRKQTRRGGRTGSSDSAGTAAAETAPPPVDGRDYQVPTASQRAPGIEVSSVFVSKVRHSCPYGRARCHFRARRR